MATDEGEEAFDRSSRVYPRSSQKKFDLQFPGFVPSCVCPRLSLRFSRFYFAGGARTFGESCTNEDTHHWLCKRTCRHAMGTVVCSLGANTNLNF